ncbi:pyridoxamine 5'-phosphate oxidase [Bdellovibrionota bacterium FG-2]
MQSYSNPFDLFNDWYKHAAQAGIRRSLLKIIYPPAVMHQPDSATLATATREGRPSARIVLFKGIKRNGFSFFTNYSSRKAAEIAQNPFVALTFHWGNPERQIRIEGSVEKLSFEESSRYWVSRPRGSQIGAIASNQSSVISDPSVLKDRVAEIEDLYKGKEIPCPEGWGGYRIEPEMIEFWEGKVFRLHDRLVFRKKGAHWETQRLAP